MISDGDAPRRAGDPPGPPHHRQRGPGPGVAETSGSDAVLIYGSYGEVDAYAGVVGGVVAGVVAGVVGGVVAGVVGGVVAGVVGGEDGG